MKFKPAALASVLLATALASVLLATVVIGSIADRIQWAGQIVGRINMTNVSINDTNCGPNDWMEVARGNGPTRVMRYRCGTVFWPFYKSGESALVATYFSSKPATTND
ncbi:hypothetical protein [Pseudomonas sp. RIT-PI-o]|uniref:hypothetical protein n=1 Tax=Pseudomonas sp. RIT-PI-o TaxID=1690246 RepID=UPI0006CC75D1|nr:hypothetical protein [Pseudomonas sp. RIT-PI-o]KPG82221.1 hypothetical protein AEQ63_13540 [Pseudomonas sp. RIT-PI-o]